MNINERIRHLRKNELNMTQNSFASNIDISRSNLGNIETGEVSVTERVIASICREFNVNEEWLRNGGGEIFLEVTPHEKAYNRFGYIMENSSSSKRAALSLLLELLYNISDEQWDAIMKQYDEIKKEG